MMKVNNIDMATHDILALWKYDIDKGVVSPLYGLAGPNMGDIIQLSDNIVGVLKSAGMTIVADESGVKAYFADKDHSLPPVLTLEYNVVS